MPKKKKYELRHEYLKIIPKEFWELADEAADKLGDVIKKEGTDLAICSGLGYISYKVFHKILGDVPAAIYGPLAYKLATTSSRGDNLSVTLLGVSIPYNSQSVGLTMLASLGIVPLIEGMYSHIEQASKEAYEDMERAVDAGECERLKNVTGREEKALWHLWWNRTRGKKCSFAVWRMNCGKCPEST